MFPQLLLLTQYFISDFDRTFFNMLLAICTLFHSFFAVHIVLPDFLVVYQYGLVGGCRKPCFVFPTIKQE